MLRNVWKCWEMFGNVWKYWKMFGNIEKCLEMLKYFLEMLRIVWKCLKCVRNVEKCLEMLRNVEQCLEMLKHWQASGCTPPGPSVHCYCGSPTASFGWRWPYKCHSWMATGWHGSPCVSWGGFSIWILHHTCDSVDSSMHCYVGGVGESLAAVWTDVWLGWEGGRVYWGSVNMLLLVNPQGAPISKPLFTLVTLLRFVASVDVQVFLHQL